MLGCQVDVLGSIVMSLECENEVPRLPFILVFGCKNKTS